MLLIQSSLSAAPLTWTGVNGGSWDTVTAANWDGTAWNNATLDEAIFGATGVGTINLVAEGITAQSLTFNATGYTIATNTLTLGGIAPTITTAANVSANISSLIAGTAGLIKAGDGILQLSALNTFSGGTIVNGGLLDLAVGGGTGAIRGALTVNSGATVKVSAVNGLGSTQNFRVTNTMLNGGTLDIQNTGNNSITASTITLVGGSLTGMTGSKFDLRYNGVGAFTSVTTNASATTSVISVGTLGMPNNNSVFTVASGSTATGIDLLISSNIVNNAGAGGSGAGVSSLSKAGAGTLKLSGTNSYTGATSVAAGVLQFAKQTSLYNNTQASWTAANLTVSSGAVAAFNVGGAGEFTASDINALQALTNVASGVSASQGFLNGAILGLDTTNAVGGLFTYGNVLANHVVGATMDTLGLRKLGTGTLQLTAINTYTGGTTVQGGTLDLAIGGASGAIRGTLVVNSGATVKVSAANALGTSQNLRVGNITLNGGTLDIQNDGNNSITSATITLVGASITGMTGSKFDLRNNGAGFANVTTNASSSTSVISVGTLGMPFNNATFTVASGTTASGVDLLISSVIVSNAGSGGSGTGVNTLIKAGNGTLQLTGLSSYSGGTIVNAGMLDLGVGGGTGAIRGVLTVNTGGTVKVSAVNGLGNTQNFRITTTTLNGGILDFQNTGSNSITSAQIYLTGGIIRGMAGSKLDLRDNGAGPTGVNTNASSTPSIISVGTLGMPGNNTSFTVASGTTTSGVDLLISSNIVNSAGTGGAGSGTSSLTKVGSGTLQLSGVNTFTGDTNLNEGTLNLASTQALQSSTLNLNGGTLVFDSTVTSGAFTLGGLKGTSDLSLTDNAGVPAAVTLTVGGNNTDTLYSGGLSGTGNLTKVGNRTLLLSGSNTYQGTTYITGGVLQFANPTSLYNSNTNFWTDTNLTINSGAVAAFNVGGVNEFTALDINMLQSLTNVASGASATQGFRNGSIMGLDTTNAIDGLFIYDSVLANHVAGATTDTLGLRKLGTGTLRLTALNTFTGGTTVNGGTLDLAIGGSTGAIRGALTVNAGAIVRVSAANGLGNSQNFRITTLALNGGTLDIQNTGNNSITSSTITLTGGSVEGMAGSKFDLRNNGAGSSNVTTVASSVTSVISVGTLGMPFSNSTFTVASGTTASGIDLLISSNIVNNAGTGGAGTGVSSLIKTGAGRLHLTGVNTYTGATSINGGRLSLASTGQTGFGAVTVLSSGAILGTGRVAGSGFTAESGSSVYAGDGIAQGDYGTLTFSPTSGSGSFDFQEGSTTFLGINPGGSSDRLNFDGLSAGTLNFDGNLIVTAVGFVPNSVETFDLLDWANLTTVGFDSRYSASSYNGYLLGNGDDMLGFDLPDIAGSGYGWDISAFITSGSISTVLIVPEPSRVLLLCFGLFVLLRRRVR